MSITISRILILIKSRRIKSRRNINESRSSNFPTIRKRFGGRPTRINRATFEDRFGRGCGFCARFEGRECRSNLFSGPFCSCMRLSTRPSRYSGHELTASLSLSLSLSSFLSTVSYRLLLQSRPVINIYVDLLSSVLEPHGKKSPSLFSSLPRPISLSYRDISSASFRLRVLKKGKERKKSGRIRISLTRIIFCYFVIRDMYNIFVI